VFVAKKVVPPLLKAIPFAPNGGLRSSPALASGSSRSFWPGFVGAYQAVGVPPPRSRETYLQIAEQFLKLMAEQAAPEKIADLFSQDLVFEIPGDDGVLPWIGRKTDEEAVELANGTDFGLKALSILAWRDS
jgi:hypothetical protein